MLRSKCTIYEKKTETKDRSLVTPYEICLILWINPWGIFTTRISPFYDDITIDVRRGVRQGDTVSPKLFTPTLEDVMRRLEWDNMGMRVDGRLLHHLRFADDIVFITPSISQAERMLADFDDAYGKIGLQLNLTKTMFIRNGWVPDAPFSLNGTTISEHSIYVYPGREVNMMNDLAPELGRRERAAWGAYKSIEDVVEKTKNTRLRAHLFNTTANFRLLPSVVGLRMVVAAGGVYANDEYPRLANAKPYGDARLAKAN
ncbi:hypothetical protein ANCCEY_10801 [Ancylostoma ceylanicum]|uniref:Reverse transcriptase domain-containing protein n=1 Tax=Ancylostoma ceylanicum TaxID=53326 RepID=A0A0D6LJH6_9BILA|nr:hypothetical protein ANCCEY_10801 [Ancylostoma ceylanicum]